VSRLDSVTTRIGPDLRDAIEVMPGLGGIALWVKFLDSDDPSLVARTDGIHVEAGPRYSEYDGTERRFILLHELLHVALAHPARAREMKKRHQDLDHRLYNIACDAIINTALDGVHCIRAPNEVVTLEKVLTVLGQWKEGDNTAEVIRRWSSEALYLAMVRSSKRVFLHALDADSHLKSEDIMATPSSIKSLSENLKFYG
jgi:Putative metallopeptidase domain